MAKLTKEKANETLRLIQEGRSTHQVAKMFDICHNSVRNILLRNKENVPKNSGGRPRKLEEDTVNYLNLKRDVFKTAVEATKEANKIMSEPVSVSTVNRRLHEVHLKNK
ncbi:hypothetical protein BGZ65_011744 [Modicella reniformis]|uniref:Transposase n=1 Tax=Modicella reniformis TaxID=1440133 RepID=A0A9P6LSR4_9FUNG|nr:hypothetical protein BGZ65_011744 [Modicella reniformis]